jgi:transposase InsO family protein
MLATLHELGVIPSFSRPSVSNDNPYSESLFRTLKYRPEYPEKPFEGLSDARSWVEGFGPLQLTSSDFQLSIYANTAMNTLKHQ